MPLDRASFEAELVDRCGNWIRESGLSADPGSDSPPRSYLNAPLRAGLAGCGLLPADPFGVADADLGQVPIAMIDRFMASAQYGAIEAAHHNYTKVTRSLGQASISASDFGDRLAAELERLRSVIVETYGVAPTRMVSGVIPMPANVLRPPRDSYPSEMAAWPFGYLPPPRLGP